MKRWAAPNPWDDPNFGMEGESSTPDEDQDQTSTPYFEELVNISHQIDDPELSQQLQELAELYRYALQIGGGYATIARAISNLKNMYSDGSDSNIEDILNGMTKELAKAAGWIGALSGKDNPAFVNKLAQLKQDIESRPQEGRSEALDAYQEDIRGAPSGETEEDLVQSGLTPEQADIINPAALGFDNKDDPKTNKGWHTVGSGKFYKNWKEYYENEKLSYEADEAGETNENIRKILVQLIKLLPVLSAKTEQALNISNALRSDVANPQEEEKKTVELKGIRKDLQQLKQTRQLLKSRIRSTQLQKEKQRLSGEAQRLSEKFNQSIDPERKEKARRELEVVNQQLALNELARSTDLYKAKERNYRLELVRQMSGGAFPSQDWINKQEQKINQASQLRISKRDYDRKLTEERGKQQNRLITPTYEPTRGGRRVPMELLPPEKQVDFEKASFKELVKKLQDDVASATSAARQIIYEKGSGKNKQIIPEYREIIDEISAAIRDKNRPALYQAQKKLVKTINDDLSVDQSHLKGYIEVIKLEPHFRKILENIRDLIKTGKKDLLPKLDNNGNLIVENFDEQSEGVLQYILNDINRLRSLYMKRYTDISGIKTRRESKPTSDWWLMKQNINNTRFKSVIEDMGRIEIAIALTLHVHRPENKKRYRELSPLEKKLHRERSPLAQEIATEQKKKWEEEWKRKTPQEKLEYEMKRKETQDKWDEEMRLNSNSATQRISLLKIAQEIKPDNEIDQATADRLANEMFDKIYDAAYQQMINQLQT